MAVLTPSQMQSEIQRKAAAGIPLTNTGNAANNAAYKAATPAVQKASVPAPSFTPKSTVVQTPQPTSNTIASSPSPSPQIQSEIQRKAAAGIPLTNTSNAANNAVYAAAVPKAAVAPKAAVSPTVAPTAQSTPTTNYVAQGGKTLNDILYLKDNYNASNKNYIASQANPLYAQLDPNTAAMVKGMSADQLRSYINGMGAKSPTTTSETSAETPVEEVVPKDYRSLATAAYERELAAMMAGAQAQETELNRRYDYANDIKQDNRTLQDSSFYRNNAPTAWDGSTGYQAAQQDRNRNIEDHYTQEALTDATAAAYGQANAFRNQSGNYIESKAAELESAEKQYNLQLAGLTGEINGQQTIQGKAAAAQLVSQNIANQIAQIDLSTYPEANALKIKQLQQQVQSGAISNESAALQLKMAQIDLTTYPQQTALKLSQLQQQVAAGKISNDAAAYQFTQLTDPNSTTNQAAALELQMKAIDASTYSEQQQLKLEQLKKTIAEIGKVPYQSETDKQLDQLKVQQATLELQKIREGTTDKAAKATTFEDVQSNIEKIAQRDKKTNTITNSTTVEDYILNSNLSPYEMYRAYGVYGLKWEGAVPSKGE